MITRKDTDIVSKAKRALEQNAEEEVLEKAYELTAKMFVLKHIKDDFRSINQPSKHDTFNIIADICKLCDTTYDDKKALNGVNKYLNQYGYKGLSRNDTDYELHFDYNEYKEE